jgi:hypothetical protein
MIAVCFNFAVVLAVFDGHKAEMKDISLDQLLEQQRTLLFRGFLYLKTFLE